MNAMQNAGFLTYVSESDVRHVIENNYSGSKEVATRIDDEDILFEHSSNGKMDVQFQVWKYNHPKRGDLWVVNVVRVTYED